MLGIIILSVLNCNTEYFDVKCCYAECSSYDVFKMGVIVLSVFTLTDVLLSGIMLGVGMLSVVVLSVVKPSVVAPLCLKTFFKRFCRFIFYTC
jgi:hypothetical protein